ncbi:MAG: CpaF family protein [Terriglobia bacterium]|nr:MAG: CpaF family protein [Terriglobia bacterium]
MSWEVILPFLRPIEPLLKDPEVTDILVNGAARVFVEKCGVLQEVPNAGLTEKYLQVAARNVARVLGDEIGPDKPLLDARLPDGSRIAAVLPPSSLTGTILAVRKFHGQRYNIDELVRLGTLTPEVGNRLRRAVENRENVLISGSTGSGKTTLMTALAGLIPDHERVVVIEDTAEIQISAGNLVRLEARREQATAAAVTIRDLLRMTLRLRPDRILLGEVRGGEAFDLLQALNTGHSGTLATLHANSASLALARFTTCILQSGIELPYRAIRSNIADAVHLLVHLDRRQGKRLVTQVFAVRGYDPALDRYDLERVYERE